MKDIKILGPSDETLELALQIVKTAHELSINYRLEQTDDEDEIVSHGVIVTPAVVIDGRLAFSGETPQSDQLFEMLS
jgi:hypothetical protein